MCRYNASGGFCLSYDIVPDKQQLETETLGEEHDRLDKRKNLSLYQEVKK